MIVSWITLLDSVPELELIQHLPAFLPGLFRTLYGRYPTSAFRKREDLIWLPRVSPYWRLRLFIRVSFGVGRKLLHVHLCA